MPPRSRSAARVWPLLLVLILTAGMGPARLLAQAPAGAAKPTTVWDGVYSKEQAQRGQKVYGRACVYCHLPNLSGGSDAAAPALTGPAFLTKWRNRSLLELFGFMADTMPKDGTPFGGVEPVHLELEEYLDLVAYILEVNGARAGAELPADERLGQMIFTDK